MSTQIQIARDRDDESTMIDWLEELGEWKYLPHTIQRKTEARPIGEARDIGDRTLVVFPSENDRLVADGVRRMDAFEGRTVTASPHARGYYFEWSRTPETSEQEDLAGSVGQAPLVQG